MDPGLQKMTFDIGSGTEVAWVYGQPNVSSFYRDDAPGSPDRNNVVTPAYKGQVCNFINLSDKEVVIFLEKNKGPSTQLRHLDPMSGKGLSVIQGQVLFFADAKGRLIQRFHITAESTSLHVYDPYYIEGYPEVTESYVAMLSQEQQHLYKKWRATIEFAQHYTRATGRAFLSHYSGPTAPITPPKHSMWLADYFGQEHWVTTREVHYDRLPPAEHLQALPQTARDRELANGDPRLLPDYRVAGETSSSSSSASSLSTMNMTLKVLSCAPRVFEIANFLSPVEVQHVLDIAQAKTLQDSSTGAKENANNATGTGTAAHANRKSQNTWIFREESPIMDSIYRRAADLLRIDEGLLRNHGRGTDTGSTVEQPTAAEPMQVVHYTPGQEYKTHVDFAYPRVDDPLQPTRFATLLLYLNEGMQGGETTFPRWMNAETSRDLQIKPELGKAVLFYSQLPDGNMDELSQHAALPVQTSEKYLANLWIWDPFVELSGM
jgi:prolyl 4-hydroxylase